MKAKDLLAGILQKTCKPKVVLDAATWAEKHIRLDPKSSLLAGRYSLRHSPYLKRLYQDVSNPRVRKIVLKKACQVGFTQFTSNVLLYYVANFVLPLMMVLPSQESATAFCERCLTPSIALCDEVQKVVTGNPDDLKKRDFLFETAILRVVGAGSPSKLASSPAAVLVLDEVDKLQDFSSQGESNAVELAEDRTVTFPFDRKVILGSTPTEENSSVIHQQYLLGSQSKFFCPCPHCGTQQVLKFSQVKWPEDCKDEFGNYDYDRIERETWLACENEQCKEKITEKQRVAMIRAGEWCDTNLKPFPAEIRSYQLSSLYSFNLTLGSLAKLFLLSKDDPAKLRNFTNSFLGECFEQRAETIKTADLEAIVAASPKYLKGQLLARPDVILLASDVQGSSLYYVVKAIYPDNSSAIIDYGMAATFEDLQIVANRQYKINGTEEYVGIFKALVDSGYKTGETYDLAIKTAYRFLPVKGVESKQQMFAPLRTSSIDYRGHRIPLLLIGDTHFKDVLYISAIKEKAIKWYLPQDVDEEFKAQLSSEHKVEKKVGGGRLVTQWKTIGRNNHYGDACRYLMAYHYFLEPQLKQKRENDAKPKEEQPRQYQMQPAKPYQPAGNSWD